ncbi:MULTISPECIES: hypothetical protein [Pseudomonas]|uniref:hypothetical protein n=1 Tax=Pseudomonas TaxID=286 RepID=UPI001FCA20EE|nr:MULTISPECIES: hypothetical protein [Pseudomonas]
MPVPNRLGKALIPPMMQLTGMSFSSWANTRLPEMLWACLVIAVIPREEAIEVFRDIASIGIRYRRDEHDQESKPALGWSLRHSDLPNQPRELFNALVSGVLQCHSGLQALRPLLLLENLPGRDWWKAALAVEAFEDDWETLGQAVLKTFDHQSQEATDEAGDDLDIFRCNAIRCADQCVFPVRPYRVMLANLAVVQNQLIWSRNATSG